MLAYAPTPQLISLANCQTGNFKSNPEFKIIQIPEKTHNMSAPLTSKHFHIYSTALSSS
jgi:hypothetical protein